MIATDTRAPTKAELDVYDDIMTERGLPFGFIAIVAIIAGVLAALLAVGAVWLHSFFTSGAAWKVPVIVGAAVTVITVVGLLVYLNADPDRVTFRAPTLATEVTATADAAWDADPDSLHSTLVLRVEPDRYLLITRDAWTPPFHEAKPPEAGDDAIPSCVRLVLLGEGKSRVAVGVSLNGPIIPRPTVDALPLENDPDGGNDTRFPDGVYTAAELPARIQEAIGLRS
jgi:hypothetical protein